MAKKVIVVLGATGAQGGGLANAVLDDPESSFSVRAVTRDVNSPKAQALAAKGAQVVLGNVNDAESLKPAFADAYGLFANSFFWEKDVKMSGVNEKHQALNVAIAARGAGFKHIVRSTLEDVRCLVLADYSGMPWLEGGRYLVPHFDAKAEADAFFAGLPVTYLLTSFYWDNFLTFFTPQKGEDGTYSVTLPMGDAKLAGIAARDIGRCAYGIFNENDVGAFVDTQVGIVGEFLTVWDMCEKMSAVLDVPVKYNPVEPNVFRGFGFPGADEIGNMFQAYRDFADGFAEERDANESEDLNPVLQDFDAWLADNKDALKAKMGVGAEPAASA